MGDHTIQFIVPVALKDVFDVIAPAYQRDSGYRFETSVMLNPEVPGYIAQGGTWSIAASNPTYIQDIINGGEAEAQMFDLGYSPLSFAALGGRDEPPADRREDIAALLCATDSIGVTGQGTSGVQFEQLIDLLEVRGTVAPKVLKLPGGGAMAQLRAKNVDVAALPLTNIAPIGGVSTIAICPRNLDVHIDLAFCLHRNAIAATRDFAVWLMEADLSALGLMRT